MVVDDAHAAGVPPQRYQYLFYVDLAARLQDAHVQCALSHLSELCSFVRVLGCYPQGGVLVHSRQQQLQPVAPFKPAVSKALVQLRPERCLRIGIVGFGNFGQFLARTFARSGQHQIYATSRSDYTAAAQRLGVKFFFTAEAMLAQAAVDRGGKDGQPLDCIILCPSILSFESVVRQLVALPGALAGILVVDVLSVKVHAKEVLQKLLPREADIICTHPMFGPESGKNGWQGLPFVYDIVRVAPGRQDRAEAFLGLFADEGCRMVPMTCQAHDEFAAGSQFITHATGRILGRLDLQACPISTKGYETLLTLVENTTKDSFDLFKGLFAFNSNSTAQLRRLGKAYSDLASELIGSGGSLEPAASLDNSHGVDISPTVRGIRQSATVRLFATTKRLKADGKDVVELNVGEPDFLPPPQVRQAMADALVANDFRYTPVAGVPALRAAVAEYMKADRGVAYAPEEILITSGGKQVERQAGRKGLFGRVC